MSDQRHESAIPSYYGVHGNRIIARGPKVIPEPLLDAGFGVALTDPAYLARFIDPTVVGLQPFRICDVLRFSFRTSSEEEDEALGEVLSVLETSMDSLPQVISDILWIAAGAMFGPSDPQALPTDPVWSALDRYVTVLLPEEPPLKVMDKAAEGLTQHFPAAVYLAGVPLQNIRDRPRKMAANMVHEYTHLALQKVYKKGSRPWHNDNDGDPSTDELRSAFRKAQASEERNAQKDSMRAEIEELRTTIKELKIHQLDPEVVPYLVEAVFRAWGDGEPNYGMQAFGPELSTAFATRVAPDLAVAAQTIRDGGLIGK